MRGQRTKGNRKKNKKTSFPVPKTASKKEFLGQQEHRRSMPKIVVAVDNSESAERGLLSTRSFLAIWDDLSDRIIAIDFVV